MTFKVVSFVFITMPLEIRCQRNKEKQEKKMNKAIHPLSYTLSAVLMSLVFLKQFSERL